MLNISDLRRCLGLLDLTSLSLGTMIGLGIYITVGEVTREAGPSIVLSYLLAGIASILSALCYAELGARYPIAGSSYQFTYMTIGEVWGFFVGWNIALEHAIGCASVGRACSGYLDSLFGNVIKDYMLQHAPMPGGLIATYPDFLGAFYLIFITVLVSFGVKLSSGLNMFFVSLNVLICGFILVSGMILGNKSNWIDEDHGGFMPHGFSATIAGAATLIYSYIGYEVVGSVAEETKNPTRNLPLSLIISIFGITVLYMSVAAAYVSIVPWYKASVDAPFSDAYAAHGWPWGSYIITVGIVFGSTSCVMAAALAIARYIFAMARDGLLPEFLAEVHPRTQIPLNATMVGGAFCVFLDIIFSLKELIDFMSIGQLIACIFVAVCVIKLRYQPITTQNDAYGELESISLQEQTPSLNTNSSNASEGTSLIEKHMSNEETDQADNKIVEEFNDAGRISKSIQESRFGYLFEWTNQYPPGNVPMYSLVVAIIFSTATVAMFLFASIYIREWWFIVLSSSFLLITVVSIIFMFMFVQDDKIDTYKIPCAPLFPFLSIVINFALMMKLDVETWIRLGIWMVVGFVIYFSYGYSHSKARKHLNCQEN